MPSQREIWEEEHQKREMFTVIHSDKPSGPVPRFLEELAEGKDPAEIRIVDAGCGSGRNSIYAGKNGFSVVGIDFSRTAIREAEKRKSFGLNNIRFQVADLTQRWPLENESVDAVIDCNASICIPNPGREASIAEALRVLKPGGKYFFYGVKKTPLVDESPGPEPNSAIFPKSGKFEKQYEEEELLWAFIDFDLERYEEIEGKDIIEGQEIAYRMFVVVFKKDA